MNDGSDFFPIIAIRGSAEDGADPGSDAVVGKTAGNRVRPWGEILLLEDLPDVAVEEIGHDDRTPDRILERLRQGLRRPLRIPIRIGYLDLVDLQEGNVPPLHLGKGESVARNRLRPEAALGINGVGNHFRLADFLLEGDRLHRRHAPLQFHHNLRLIRGRQIDLQHPVAGPGFDGPID